MIKWFINQDFHHYHIYYQAHYYRHQNLQLLEELTAKLLIDVRIFFRINMSVFCNTCINNVIVEKLLYTPKDCAINQIWIRNEEK